MIVNLNIDRRKRRFGGFITPTIEKLMSKIKDNDIVADLGGAAMPFNRANYIIDMMPYEKRGQNGSIGPLNEYFTKDTWLIHDMCNGMLPFKDKELDFILCGHTLEDIRDPIHVCSEMIRVSKGGYLECPARSLESIMSLQQNGMLGFGNHRWFVEIKNNEVIFTEKTHLTYTNSSYYLPKSFENKIPWGKRSIGLFWDNNFKYKENILIHHTDVKNDLINFVKNIKKEYE